MGLRDKVTTRSPRVLNSWLLFTTVGVIAVVFFFYLFIYVENNEKQQISKRFRVLGQMCKNVRDKKNALDKMVKNAVEATQYKLIIWDFKDKKKKELAKVFQKKINVRRIEDELIDAESLKIIESDNLSTRDNIVFDEFIGGKKSFQYYIYMEKDKFFTSLLRKDVFDGLIILEKNDIQKLESKEKKKETNCSPASKVCYKVYYHSFNGDLELNNPGLLSKKNNLFSAGTHVTAKIFNKSHHMFFMPVELEDGNMWYIGGVIASEKFQEQVRRLTSELVILLLIVFLIFIFLIPLLKLYLMSANDQLHPMDAVLTSMALMLIITLVILLNILNFQEFKDEKMIEKNLETTAQSIESNFYKELNNAYSTLKQFDSYESPGHTWLNTGLIPGHNSVYNILASPRVSSSRSVPIIDYNQLDAFIRQLLPYPYPPRYGPCNFLFRPLNFLNLGCDLLKTFSGQMPSSRYLHRYNLFKLIFWMDKNGRQITELQTRNYGGSLSTLAHRNYFKNAGKWLLPGNNPKSNARFMLESITSSTSGEKLAAISMVHSRPKAPGKTFLENAVVAAMTTRLTSVIDTVMPLGYRFAIIDHTGKTWFHSNTDRNLQENFIEETGSDKQLRSAIYAKQERSFIIYYQGKKQRCHIIPLQHLPLFLVTFFDSDYSISTNTGIIINTVLFIGIILIFNGLLFFVSGIINYKSPSLGQQYIYFDWMRPRVCDRSKRTYTNLIAVNIGIALAVVLAQIWAGRFTALFMCLSGLVFSFSYNYTAMSRLIHPCYKKCRINTPGMILFLVGFLVLIDFISGFAVPFSQFVLLVVFQVVVLIFLWQMYRFIPPQVKENGGSINENLIMRRYTYVIFSWLIVVCAVPLLIFYNDAYNAEQELSVKYSQHELAKAIEARNKSIDAFYQKKMNPPGGTSPLLEQTRNQRKQAGIYAGAVGFEYPLGKKSLQILEQLPAPGEGKEDTAYLFQIPFETHANKKRTLMFPAASDRSLTWKKDPARGKIYLEYRLQEPGKNKNPDDIKIGSQLKYFHHTFSGWSFLLSLSALIGTLIAAYYLVRFETRNIFGLKLLKDVNPPPPGDVSPVNTGRHNGQGIGPPNHQNDPVSISIRNHVEAGSHILLLCRTQSQVDDFINSSSHHVMECCEFEEIKLADLPSLTEPTGQPDQNGQTGQTKQKTAPQSYRVYQVRHCHFDPDNSSQHENLKKKIKRVENLIQLMKNPSVRLVIPALLPFSEIAYLYETAADNLPDENKSGKDGNNTAAQMRRLADLLVQAEKSMVPIYMPINCDCQPNPQYEWIGKIDDEEIKELIENEFKPSPYFKKIEKAVYNKYIELEDDLPVAGSTVIQDSKSLYDQLKARLSAWFKSKTDRYKEQKARNLKMEKLILTIRDLSHSYYYNLLQSCTHSEKYILYDLARDMLINPTSRETIGVLVQKGLLVYDGTVNFMNESFRSYVLSTIDTQEAKELIEDISVHGRWKAYRAPISLFILGSFIFLAFQRDLLSDLDAALTALVGGIAILTKFTGLFSNWFKSQAK